MMDDDALSLSPSPSPSHGLKASQRPSPPETVCQPASSVASCVMSLHQAAGKFETFSNNKPCWLKGSKLKGTAFTRCWAMSLRSSLGVWKSKIRRWKGPWMYPGSGQNALEDAARTIPGKGMLSLAKHAIKFSSNIVPQQRSHGKETLVAHDKLPEDSVWSSHVFITSNGEDIRSRDWPAKPHCGGAPVLRGSSIVACLWLSPMECSYVAGIWGPADVRYCWVRYGAASGAELAANQEGQTALRKTQADEEHDRPTAKPSGQARNSKAQWRIAPKVSHHALRPGGTPRWTKRDGHDHLTTKSTG